MSGSKKKVKKNMVEKSRAISKKTSSKKPAVRRPQEEKTSYDEKYNVERDKNGKFVGSGNPLGSRDPRIHALRNKMRNCAMRVECELMKAIMQDVDGKLKVAAIKIWYDFCVPKLRGEDVSDMQEKSRAALENVAELPLEKQAQKLLSLYYAGEISASILQLTTAAIAASQHIYDEAIEQKICKLESEQDADQKN